jgi:hypothetical protein
MNRNQAQYTIHVFAAILCVLLSFAHDLLITVNVVLQKWGSTALGVVCTFAALWLAVRMIGHAIGAVAKEIDRQNKAARHAAIMKDAMDNAFDNALIHTNGKAHPKKRKAA